MVKNKARVRLKTNLPVTDKRYCQNPYRTVATYKFPHYPAEDDEDWPCKLPIQPESPGYNQSNLPALPTGGADGQAYPTPVPEDTEATKRPL